MNNEIDIYNVWANLILGILPLLDRKVLHELQSFDAKGANISEFDEIGKILQKVLQNRGMISAEEKRMIDDKLEKIKKRGAPCYIHAIVTLFDNHLPSYNLMHSNRHMHNLRMDSTIIQPLNSMYKEQHIKIYPHIKSTLPNQSKQDLILCNINAALEKHIFIWDEDEKDCNIVFHYLGDFFGGKIIDDKLNIAVSPICDYAKIDCEFDKENGVNILKVNGITNKEEVRKRCVDTLIETIDSGANIIVFPELMGMSELEDDFRNVLEKSKEDALIFLPSYMKDGYNCGLIMYGPGKRDIIIQNKLHPFHLKRQGVSYMENIKVGKELHIIMIEKVGGIAEAICVDYLENDVRYMLSKMRTDIIVNPSLSPGYNYFYDVYGANKTNNLNSIWVNTCSVFRSGLFDKNYQTGEISMLSKCRKGRDEKTDIKCMCDEECKKKKTCYFIYTLKI